jgi:hypothetical protein
MCRLMRKHGTKRPYRFPATTKHTNQHFDTMHEAPDVNLKRRQAFILCITQPYVRAWSWFRMPSKSIAGSKRRSSENKETWEYIAAVRPRTCHARSYYAIRINSTAQLSWSDKTAEMRCVLRSWSNHRSLHLIKLSPLHSF